MAQHQRADDQVKRCWTERQPVVDRRQAELDVQAFCDRGAACHAEHPCRLIYRRHPRTSARKTQRVSARAGADVECVPNRQGVQQLLDAWLLDGDQRVLLDVVGSSPGVVPFHHADLPILVLRIEKHARAGAIERGDDEENRTAGKGVLGGDLVAVARRPLVALPVRIRAVPGLMPGKERGCIKTCSGQGGGRARGDLDAAQREATDCLYHRNKTSQSAVAYESLDDHSGGEGRQIVFR